MAINPDEDTELNDALRRHGILPQKPEAPCTSSPPPSPMLDELLEDFKGTPDQLRKLAEDTRSDEEAQIIEDYRRKRIEEMRREQRRARYGRVFPISREDYMREVTDASAIDEDATGDEDKEWRGAGTGVVCFLYKDGHVASERAFIYLRTLASRHPYAKFVSIVGSKCIPNYPDRHLPTIFVYRKGELVYQQIAWGMDNECGLEDLENFLVQAGAISKERSIWKPQVTVREDLDDLSDDQFSRSAAAKVNQLAPKNVRGKSEKGSDSDSDFDL